METVPVWAPGVPTGLIALWNLMTSSRQDLVGPSRPVVADGLGDRLGFGAFATVHKATENPKHVIKVSRYGATVTLLQEASVLSKLQEDRRSVNFGLSQLIVRKNQAVTIGGINIELPALILAPRGISAEMHLARCGENGVKEALLKIGKEIAEALDFVHAKHYNHNDVSPKNIMFDGEKAFLIDFGFASSHQDKARALRELFAIRTEQFLECIRAKNGCRRRNMTSQALRSAWLLYRSPARGIFGSPFNLLTLKNQAMHNEKRNG
jgi:serine/threonine protein kinase